VADFLGKVLDTVAGTFERLGHEDDLQTCLASDVLGILNVTHKNQIAEAVHLRVSAQHLDSSFHIAAGERVPHIGKHFEVAGILRIRTGTGGLGAVGEAEEKIPMRSRLIMNFIQARSSRASLSGTSWAYTGSGAGLLILAVLMLAFLPCGVAARGRARLP